MIVSHIQSLLRFYGPWRNVEIKSSFGTAASMERLKRLDPEGKVGIHISRRGKITATCTQHSARSNILTAFTGLLEEKEGGVTLRGQLGVDIGVRVVLSLFCLYGYVWLPVETLIKGGSMEEFRSMIGPMLFLFTLVEACYLMGRRDRELILRHLSQALRPDSSTSRG